MTMTRQMSQISIDNYFSEVEPKLTNKESWVLEAIEELYPCTSEMVAEHYGVGINKISGRFTGLRNKGKIKIAYVVRNPRTVGYYMPTEVENEYTDIS